MDWDSIDENDGGPTYMSLSASSYHPGGVNALFADGSVHYAKSSISAVAWRNLGTIAGGEVVSGDAFWRAFGPPPESGKLHIGPDCESASHEPSRPGECVSNLRRSDSPGRTAPL